MDPKYDMLRQLTHERDRQKRRRESACARLVDLWDRRGRGESWPTMEEDLEAARLRIEEENDRAGAMKAVWIEEWKRVGMPVGAEEDW